MLPSLRKLALAIIFSLLCAPLHAQELAGQVAMQMGVLERSERVAPFVMPAGAEHQSILNRTQRYLYHIKVPVYIVSIDEDLGLRGATGCPVSVNNYKRCYVLLDETLSPDGRLLTLLHEYAHVIMIGQSKRATANEAEAIVESATWLALRELGWDTSYYNINYLMTIEPRADVERALLTHELYIKGLALELVKAGRYEQ